MKKLRFLICLLALVSMLFPTAAFLAEEAASADAAALDDDVYAFQLSIEGKVYTFPTSFAEFEAEGWKLKDASDAEGEMAPGYYDTLTLVNGPLDDQIEMTAYFLNTDINTKAITECPVAGADISLPYNANKRAPVVVAAQGIALGTSSRADIEAAYGEPSSLYENEEYKTATLTYSKATYQEAKFRLEEDVLQNIQMRNFVASEEKGEVSDAVPEEVTNYVAPTELGDDLLSQVVEYDGDLYRLPAPISAFEANGWKVMEYRSDYIPSKDSVVSGVTMMRNNQSMKFSLYNPTGEAILSENALVSMMPPIGGLDALVLPAGIQKGSTSEELFAAYDGVIKVLTERDEYNTYSYSERGVFWVTISVDNTTKLVTDISISAP